MSTRTERQGDRHYFVLMVLTVLGIDFAVMALCAVVGLLGWPEAMVAAGVVALISLVRNTLTWHA